MRFEELGLEPWVPPAASDLETAQGRLALFLRDLPRLFQRLIVGLNPRGVFDTINEEYLSEQRKGELRQARREYRRLVVAVARELTNAAWAGCGGAAPRPRGLRLHDDRRHSETSAGRSPSGVD